jgi:hypothetical protein
MTSILDVNPTPCYLPIKRISDEGKTPIFFYSLKGQEAISPKNPDLPVNKQMFDVRVHCLNDNNEYLITARQGTASYNHIFKLIQKSIKNGWVIAMRAKKIGEGSGSRNDYMDSKIASERDYNIDAHESRMNELTVKYQGLSVMSQNAVTVIDDMAKKLTCGNQFDETKIFRMTLFDRFHVVTSWIKDMGIDVDEETQAKLDTIRQALSDGDIQYGRLFPTKLER